MKEKIIVTMIDHFFKIAESIPVGYERYGHNYLLGNKIIVKSIKNQSLYWRITEENF